MMTRGLLPGTDHLALVIDELCLAQITITQEIETRIRPFSIQHDDAVLVARLARRVAQIGKGAKGVHVRLLFHRRVLTTAATAQKDG
jgi:hypothetical protein